MRIRRWLQVNGLAYLFALAGVLIATGVRYQLGPVLGNTIPVVIFTVPVVLSALYGGFGPGFFCTLISAVISDYLFIAPYYSLALTTEASVVLSIFLAIGLAISYFGQRMKAMQVNLVRQAGKLEKANRELAQANRSKDEFLAMLAHELRNPLAGISTAAELLKFIRSDQHRIAQTSEMISRQVRHMTKLVDDLLDVSRVTRGLVMIEKKPVDLKETLQGAIEQLHTALESKQQQLTVNMPDEDVCVSGDRTRLTQVIGNLVANANRYSPAGSAIQVQIHVAQSEAEISVEDNGQGIDQALLPHIFDLFVQAERSIDRAQGGLGIGLALVKKITELHDGKVSAYSAGSGKGSRFTITLPRLKQQAKQEPAHAGPAASLDAGHPMQILVVDDNHDAADSTALLLEAYGHTVFVEYGAKAALDRVHAEELDAIILDIGLPEKDGRVLCRQMKMLPHLANTVFIAISGYGQETDVRMSKEAGFDHHFAKPVQVKDLLDVLATNGVRRTETVSARKQDL